MDSKWTTYKELELITEEAPNTVKTQFAIKAIFGKITTWLLSTLAPSNEPKIWFKTDRNGLVWWYIYDPVSNHRVCCSSQAEVLAWLEDRYYNC